MEAASGFLKLAASESLSQLYSRWFYFSSYLLLVALMICFYSSTRSTASGPRQLICFRLKQRFLRSDATCRLALSADSHVGSIGAELYS